MFSLSTDLYFLSSFQHTRCPYNSCSQLPRLCNSWLLDLAPQLTIYGRHRDTWIFACTISCPPPSSLQREVSETLWTKTQQWATMPGHPANHMAAYKQLLQASPTKTANQPLLTLVKNGQLQAVMVTMLARALSLMLQAQGLDTGLYSLHSLHRGVPQLSIWLEQLDIYKNT